jgi:hypothetical protein
MKCPWVLAGALLALAACKSDETARLAQNRPIPLPGGGCSSKAAPVCCQAAPTTDPSAGTCVANTNACVAGGGLVTREPIYGCS